MRRSDNVVEGRPVKNNWRFSNNEIKYVKEVLLSGFASSTSGNMCQRFEAEFCKLTGAKYCILMNSGTSTMHAALAAFGIIGPGDEVLVPALTVISTANVVIHQNAVPIFVDIDPDTFNIDPEDIKRKITPRTKAIIVVALYGLPPNMDEIMKIADEHNLKVILDAAEANMATLHGVNIAKLGHMCSFSFENSKHMTCGDGGCLTTDDPELATKARKFASQGYKSITSAEGRIRINKDVFQDPSYLRHDAIGWNYRMPESSAAILMAQIQKIRKFIKYRVNIANAYAKVIKKTRCDFLIPQKVPNRYLNTYWCFTCKFDAEKAKCSWQEFRKKFMEFGGTSGIYAAWLPVYLEGVYRNYQFYGKGCPHKCPLYTGEVKYEPGLCPVTERVQKQLMQFVNNHKGVKDAQPEIDALEKTICWCQGKG